MCLFLFEGTYTLTKAYLPVYACTVQCPRPPQAFYDKLQSRSGSWTGYDAKHMIDISWVLNYPSVTLTRTVQHAKLFLCNTLTKSWGCGDREGPPQHLEKGSQRCCGVHREMAFIAGSEVLA